MAGGLNKQFLKDPLLFLRKHLISVVDGNMQTGTNKVGFYADRERVLLKQFIGPVGKHQHPFNCYFLRALPDTLNPGIGFNGATEDYFFTSTLSGCQFLAYGASRNSLTIEHNNYLSGHGSYDGRYQQIQGGAVSARIHNGGSYNIDDDDVGNVVGIRDGGGWHLYFQKIGREKGAMVKTSGKIVVSKKTITLEQMF